MTSTPASSLTKALLHENAIAQEPQTLFACSHCTSCGYNNFPSSDVCPRCWSKDVQVMKLSPTGVLYSFSSMRIEDARQFVGYIDLPEDVRVFGRLTGSDLQNPVCGMPVKLAAVQPPGSGPCFVFASASQEA